MSRIPQAGGIDSSLAFIRDPYLFISSHAQALGTDLFQTRLMLQPTICLTGPEAAELFHDRSRFVRKGAMPSRIQKPLLGPNGVVQSLDDEAHHHRKQMHMSLMTPERVQDLARLTGDGWRTSAPRWAAMGRVVLYDEMKRLITRAVCAWAGVPLPEAEVGDRARQMSARFEGAGAVGPRYWRAQVARRQTERWVADIVERIRSGQLDAPEQGAAHVIAMHRDLNGQLLEPEIAASDLLSILRPTEALAVFTVFIAHALHQHPEIRERLRAGDDDEYKTQFVQEVRRFYPFFPVTTASVRQDFEWKGYRFPEGRRVLLDLYGTNHDTRTWDEPQVFRPERFRQWNGSPFSFIPQGGGDHHLDHRCAGEWITIAVMRVATQALARDLSYEVPAQNLSVDFATLPALPRSRFVMTNVGVNA